MSNCKPVKSNVNRIAILFDALPSSRTNLTIFDSCGLWGNLLLRPSIRWVCNLTHFNGEKLIRTKLIRTNVVAPLCFKRTFFDVCLLFSWHLVVIKRFLFPSWEVFSIFPSVHSNQEDFCQFEFEAHRIVYLVKSFFDDWANIRVNDGLCGRASDLGWKGQDFESQVSFFS